MGCVWLGVVELCGRNRKEDSESKNCSSLFTQSGFRFCKASCRFRVQDEWSVYSLLGYERIALQVFSAHRSSYRNRGKKVELTRPTGSENSVLSSSDIQLDLTKIEDPSILPIQEEVPVTVDTFTKILIKNLPEVITESHVYQEKSKISIFSCNKFLSPLERSRTLLSLRILILRRAVTTATFTLRN